MKQEIRLPKGYELKELEKGVYEIVKSEFKLEVGKDYIRRNNPKVIVIDRKNDFDNNSFYSGVGFNSMSACSNAKEWREATESEVIEAFEKELVRRYGENWKDVKLKECINLDNNKVLNSEVFNAGIGKSLHGWEVWNKNGRLFYKGKWAEVLEEIPIIELRGLDKKWKWCAMDDDRRVYIHESKPNKNNAFNCWYDRNGDALNCKHLDQSQFSELKKLNWKDSLHKIKHV